MEITIRGAPKEIAALVRATQERQKQNSDSPAKLLGQIVVEAMNDMQRDVQDKSLLRPEQTADTED